jgi:hypothetical protein
MSTSSPPSVEPCAIALPAPEIKKAPPCRVTAGGSTDCHGASIYLGTSERTLRRWRKESTGPAYAVIGGRIWYALADLDVYIAECRHEPLGK